MERKTTNFRRLLLKNQKTLIEIDIGALIVALMGEIKTIPTLFFVSRTTH